MYHFKQAARLFLFLDLGDKWSKEESQRILNGPVHNSLSS